MGRLSPPIVDLHGFVSHARLVFVEEDCVVSVLDDEHTIDV